MIYLLMFSISLILIYFGIKNKNKMFGKIMIFIGLIIPCIMAGLRGMNVGSDTKGYVYNLYNNAKNIKHFSGMISFSDWLYYSKDYAYLFVTFVIAKLGLPFQVLLFVIECLIVFPIYYAIKINSKNNKEIIVGMSLFYLLLYNLSLNMVRQSIAIAFVILIFSIFINALGKRYVLKSVFLLLIGIFFHDTALSVIPLYLIYLLFNSNKIKPKHKQIVFAGLITIIIIMSIFYKQILLVLGNSGIYPKALMYLNKYSILDFNYMGTTRNALIIATVLINKKVFMKEEYRFVLLLGVLNIVLGLLGMMITYADRISYYALFILALLYIPKLLFKKNKITLNGLVLLSFMVLNWIVVILINNSNETLPYVLFR